MVLGDFGIGRLLGLLINLGFSIILFGLYLIPKVREKIKLIPEKYKWIYLFGAIMFLLQIFKHIYLFLKYG